MEQTKFTVLVNELLEPKFKAKIEQRLKFPSCKKTDNHREDSTILRPRHSPQPCSDCGEIVSGRVVEYVIYAIGSKNQHWKKCCNLCKKKTKMERGLKDIEK